MVWFIVDGLGITLSLLTYALLAFADWVVVRYVLLAWCQSDKPRLPSLPLTDAGLIVCGLYQLLIFLSFYSHFRAMTSDPGTITEPAAPASFQDARACRLCQGRWKPPRAHHCKTCNSCIFRMDHHCPWVNNCVGLSNQKLFILFLCYTALSALATLLLFAISAVAWLWSQKSWKEAGPPGNMALICSSLVTVKCLAAVLFVGDFLQEQIESIQMNSTLVETYQRTHGKRSCFMDHFRSVFGHNWLLWAIPIHTAPKADYLEAAIADDTDVYAAPMGRETDSLGIAGAETEDSQPRSRHEAAARAKLGGMDD
eukprot:TRINITY_DN47728_c0_g1_i1.p1 TRINITY_DN47728_c0_g1~~TRINITY_DN47728_c0_g1_i1.p1  ORF type:complete len:312 (-),score=21.75 TRINITY_DN47728_c0_g1_i1:249-1184(-)